MITSKIFIQQLFEKYMMIIYIIFFKHKLNQIIINFLF